MFAKKNVLAAALIAAVCAGAWAQDAGAGVDGRTVFERFPSSLGAYVCSSTGGGLSYQHWFGHVGVQATLGGLADGAGSFEYSVQGAFQYMIYGEDFADWFSGALYTNVMVAHRGLVDATASTGYEAYEYLGLGVGIEMAFLRHLSTAVEFMYVGTFPTFALDFGFGGSLRYRF